LLLERFDERILENSAAHAFALRVTRLASGAYLPEKALDGNAHCTIWQLNCQLSAAGFSQEFKRLTLLRCHEWQSFMPPLCK
jgi:hypothetical protein